jgi:hypothetical protein
MTFGDWRASSSAEEICHRGTETPRKHGGCMANSSEVRDFLVEMRHSRLKRFAMIWVMAAARSSAEEICHRGIETPRKHGGRMANSGEVRDFLVEMRQSCLQRFAMIWVSGLRRGRPLKKSATEAPRHRENTADVWLIQVRSAIFLSRCARAASSVLR